jgi:hypothetical protein
MMTMAVIDLFGRRIPTFRNFYVEREVFACHRMISPAGR